MDEESSVAGRILRDDTPGELCAISLRQVVRYAAFERNHDLNAAAASMGGAGADLAGLVKAQIVSKGARYVVVVNMREVAQTTLV